jgi:CMP-N-acetylneuraminic acid synthetase
VYPHDCNNIKDPQNAARQLFPQTYWPVGYIDIYCSQLVLKNKTLKGKRMIPYIIEEEAINIGSFNELDLAKLKIVDFVFD